MVRFEKDKIVIEIESVLPADDWCMFVRDIISAVGAIDKDLVDNNNDCIYGLSKLLLEMMPEEIVLRKMISKDVTPDIIELL